MPHGVAHPSPTSHHPFLEHLEAPLLTRVPYLNIEMASRITEAHLAPETGQGPHAEENTFSWYRYTVTGPTSCRVCLRLLLLNGILVQGGEARPAFLWQTCVPVCNSRVCKLLNRKGKEKPELLVKGSRRFISASLALGKTKSSQPVFSASLGLDKAQARRGGEGRAPTDLRVVFTLTDSDGDSSRERPW